MPWNLHVYPYVYDFGQGIKLLIKFSDVDVVNSLCSLIPRLTLSACQDCHWYDILHNMFTLYTSKLSNK